MRIIIFLTLLNFAVSYVSAQEYINWEAEDFIDSKGEKFQVFEVPAEQKGASRCVDLEDYKITESPGDTYIGVPNGLGNMRYNLKNVMITSEIHALCITYSPDSNLS